MALVGTISGSNGTSVTAITGALIIADESSARFPSAASLGSGVKLFISGAKTETGADSPVAVFGGDTFVSGAFGTDSYIQMKPVNVLRIPTNTTASYIYTSGSTNDMYFTQYQPGTGYTNTTRLRWLESCLPTGLLHGGTLSTANGTTTFSITSGSGVIVTMNASATTDPYPTINNVIWPAYVSQSLTYVSTNQITYVGIDAAGAIVQRSSPFSNSDDESYIVLGRVLHQAGSVTNGTNTAPITAYAQTQAHDDYLQAIGPLKLSGHVLSAAGANLQLNKTAGEAFAQGRNYTVNPSSPNIILTTTDTAVTTSKIYREYVLADGVTYVQDTGVGAAGFTVIDPGQYNNGGTLASVSSGQYTIQRVYWFPNSVTRAFTVYYGSATYNSLDSAQAALNSESFTEGANTRNAAILVAYLIVKGNASDLSNTAQARFIPAGIFRAAGTGGGGGGGTTIPGGSDTYVQFNDAGSFGGEIGLRFDKVTSTTSAGNLVVTGSGNSLVSSGTVQVKDGTGTVVVTLGSDGAISGSSHLTIGGNITGSNLRLTTLTAGSVLFAGTSGAVTQDNSSIYFDDTNNRLGLLTTSPQQTLHVKGKAELEAGGVTANLADQIVFAASTLPTQYLHKIQTSHDSTAANNNKVTFDMWNGSANVPILSLSGSGNAQLRTDLSLGGNLAVNGGNITTTATTFNLLAGASSALNIGNAAATNTVSGQTKFTQGLSGSLTRLSDGTSYIIAGSGVTVATGSTGAITVSSTIPAGFATALFGTGIDGDLTVADGATVTASKETYYNNLTIQGSGSFKPAGFRIFVRGTLTISASGSINDNGNSAVTSTQGAALAARGYLVGQTSAGGASQSVAGNGVAAGTALGNCSLNDTGVLANGGAGGNVNARTGGAANTLTVMFFSQGIWGAWQAGRAATTSIAPGNSTGFNGGGSGGSGGNDTGAGTVSGAGGSGAGIVWVAAQTVSNSGKISANGGAGGAATGAGNAGGGGGGGGGSVTLITNTAAASCGTVQALGGAGGAGVGTGVAGSAGSVGSTCVISFGGN